MGPQSQSLSQTRLFDDIRLVERDIWQDSPSWRAGSDLRNGRTDTYGTHIWQIMLAVDQLAIEVNAR